MAGGDEIVKLVIRTATLDSFGFTNVGFVKIDVEGHEEAVLRGAQMTLARDMPNIIIEIEERHAPGATTAVPEFLRTIGYSGYYIDESQIVDIAIFLYERDQPLGNISGGMKSGRYINNFIFVRGERAQGIRSRLQRIMDDAASRSSHDLTKLADMR
jgi:hypothetical protein